MQSLILGTAQWGLDYGATNRIGRLPDEVLAPIISTARGLGIDSLDTAPGYGDAESRIGQWAVGFRVQTKVAAAGTGGRNLPSQVRGSLARIGASSAWSVLVHDWPSVPPGDRAEVAAQVEALRETGLAERVGISGYTADDLGGALESFRRLDVAQLPVSVLDQRLVHAAHVTALRNGGGLLQARSVLLQGVLADADSPWSGHPDVIRLRDAGDAVALSLEFIRACEWVDEVVVAATAPGELVEVVDALRATPSDVDWGALASEDLRLLDPRTWATTS